MRSTTRSRYYIQVPLTDRLEDWPEERLWNELEVRFAPLAERAIVRGPALEMSIAPLRSYVCETMRHGRLFLAGDSAHIVPPTGAKGLNLAASDVAYLSEALITHYKLGGEADLHGYQAKALARIWKAELFSWYLTKLMHYFPEDGPFEQRMQVAEPLMWPSRRRCRPPSPKIMSACLYDRGLAVKYQSPPKISLHLNLESPGRSGPAFAREP